MILGLPDETREMMMQTAKTLADLGVDGVKIHDLCVMKNTTLEKMYEKGGIKLLEEDEYVELVCDFLGIFAAGIHNSPPCGQRFAKIESCAIMAEQEV